MEREILQIAVKPLFVIKANFLKSDDDDDDDASMGDGCGPCSVVSLQRQRYCFLIHYRV
jgi:hypothetical protein